MLNISKDLVSLMVPAYNQEDYIVDSLDSIYAQTYQEIELLIANDFSKDRTLDVIKDWVNKHKERFVRCEIFDNPVNLGISKNCNLLLKAADGKYLKLLAGDDMLMPDAIEKQVSFFENNPETDLLYANAFSIGASDHYPIKSINKQNLYYAAAPHYENGIAEAMSAYSVIPAPTVMLKNTTVKNFGLYREDLAFEDWEYFLRLATGGAKIAYLDYVVVAYRMLEVSASHFGKGEVEEERFDKVLEDEERVISEYIPKMKDKSMDKFWNIRLYLCIDRGFDTTLKKILKEKKFNLSKISKILLITYKLGIYHVLKKLYGLYKK